MDIFVLGDIHGEFQKLNTFINRKQPHLILQCGDFGYWPQFDGQYELGNHKRNLAGEIIKKRKWYQCSIKNKSTKIYFCDGNHEDHWSLAKIKSAEICPNIYYMKRGSCLTLPDGRNVLFIGGAESIDKNSRTMGVDWFPEETIRQADIWNLPDVKVDIVVSHTCPDEFKSDLKINNYGKFVDPSQKALSYVLKKYRPALWYFAHFHTYQKGVTRGIQWTALNHASHTGWFEKLPLLKTLSTCPMPRLPRIG